MITYDRNAKAWLLRQGGTITWHASYTAALRWLSIYLVADAALDDEASDYSQLE